jgi:VanZ family protein
LAESRVAQLPVQMFVRYWLPVLMYVGVILVLSAQQNLQPPIQFRNADKFYHVLEYTGLGVLLARACRVGRQNGPPIGWVWRTLALGVMVGTGDEIFQSFVPTRQSSVYDLLADCTGLLLAQVVTLLVARE